MSRDIVIDSMQIGLINKRRIETHDKPIDIGKQKKNNDKQNFSAPKISCLFIKVFKNTKLMSMITQTYDWCILMSRHDDARWDQMRLIRESQSEILTLLKDPDKLIAALHAK